MPPEVTQIINLRFPACNTRELRFWFSLVLSSCASRVSSSGTYYMWGIAESTHRSPIKDMRFGLVLFELERRQLPPEVTKIINLRFLACNTRELRFWFSLVLSSCASRVSSSGTYYMRIIAELTHRSSIKDIRYLVGLSWEKSNASRGDIDHKSAIVRM